MEWMHDARTYWSFWSVRLGSIALTFTGTGAVYATARLLEPSLVAGIPSWIPVATTYGAMIFTFAAGLARGIRQQPPAEKS